MSKELDRLIAMANSDTIEEMDMIGVVLEQFLDIPLNELTEGKELLLTYLVGDIASGFMLDEGKIRDLKIRDILTLIGYEPGLPWFEVPEGDQWFYGKAPDKAFFTAGNCFALARHIARNCEKDYFLGQFMRIDYWSLTKYLGDSMTDAARARGVGQREIMRRGMRLNRIYKTTYDLVSRYMDMDEDSDITTGDVIKTAVRNGTSIWLCGTQPLSEHVERVYTAYNCMRYLFMDCIRMCLIDAGRGRYRELLDMCSESGAYDPEYYEQMDFEGCYEYAGAHDQVDRNGSTYYNNTSARANRQTI